jgi:hypothetical protein
MNIFPTNDQTTNDVGDLIIFTSPNLRLVQASTAVLLSIHLAAVILALIATPIVSALTGALRALHTWLQKPLK